MKRTLLFVLVPFLSGCGLLLVEGPAPNWEFADERALQAMAISQPCTDSQVMPRIDLILSGANLIFGMGFLLTDAPRKDALTSWITGDSWTKRNNQRNATGSGMLFWSGMQLWSWKKGRDKVNDCRAFNARLLQAGRGDAVGQATYEWLDELFPLRDLGVTAFDPVFGLPIKQGH